MAMKKNQALLKHSLFYTIGQYIAEKSISALVFIIVFEAGLWAMLSFFINDQISNGMFMRCSAFVIPICFKCFFAIIEKYGELSIGFNLKDYFPIKNTDILKLRLYSKVLNPSEYFFWAAIWFFSFKLFELRIAFIVLFLATLVYYFVFELLAFISYQFEKFESPVKEIMSLLISCILFTVMPAILNYFNIPQNYYTYVYNVIIAIALILIFRVIFVLLFGKKRDKKILQRKTKISHISNSIPSARWMLVKKDLLYFTKDKKSVLLFPVIYLVIFYFIGGFELISSILPIYFPLEFAIAYGFNYFGHDNETLTTILLSPLSKKEIIQEKNGLYAALSLGFSTICFGISIALKILALSDTIYYFSFVLISLSIMLPLCSKFSIKYYHRANGKSRYTIRFMFISIGLLSVLSLLNSILVALEFNQSVLLLVSILSATIALYRNCFSVDHLVNKLLKNERNILNKLLQ